MTGEEYELLQVFRQLSPDGRQQAIPRGSFVVLHDVPDGILY